MAGSYTTVPESKPIQTSGEAMFQVYILLICMLIISTANPIEKNSSDGISNENKTSSVIYDGLENIKESYKVFFQQTIFKDNSSLSYFPEYFLKSIKKELEEHFIYPTIITMNNTSPSIISFEEHYDIKTYYSFTELIEVSQDQKLKYWTAYFANFMKNVSPYININRYDIRKCVFINKDTGRMKFLYGIRCSIVLLSDLEKHNDSLISSPVIYLVQKVLLTIDTNDAFKINVNFPFSTGICKPYYNDDTWKNGIFNSQIDVVKIGAVIKCLLEYYFINLNPQNYHIMHALYSIINNNKRLQNLQNIYYLLKKLVPPEIKYLDINPLDKANDYPDIVHTFANNSFPRGVHDYSVPVYYTESKKESIKSHNIKDLYNLLLNQNIFLLPVFASSYESQFVTHLFYPSKVNIEKSIFLRTSDIISVFSAFDKLGQKNKNTEKERYLLQRFMEMLEVLALLEANDIIISPASAIVTSDLQIYVIPEFNSIPTNESLFSIFLFIAENLNLNFQEYEYSSLNSLFKFRKYSKVLVKIKKIVSRNNARRKPNKSVELSEILNYRSISMNYYLVNSTFATVISKFSKLYDLYHDRSLPIENDTQRTFLTQSITLSTKNIEDTLADFKSSKDNLSFLYQPQLIYYKKGGEDETYEQYSTGNYFYEVIFVYKMDNMITIKDRLLSLNRPETIRELKNYLATYNSLVKLYDTSNEFGICALVNKNGFSLTILNSIGCIHRKRIENGPKRNIKDFARKLLEYFLSISTELEVNDISPDSLQHVDVLSIQETCKDFYRIENGKNKLLSTLELNTENIKLILHCMLEYYTEIKNAHKFKSVKELYNSIHHIEEYLTNDFKLSDFKYRVFFPLSKYMIETAEDFSDRRTGYLMFRGKNLIEIKMKYIKEKHEMYLSLLNYSYDFMKGKAFFLPKIIKQFDEVTCLYFQIPMKRIEGVFFRDIPPISLKEAFLSIKGNSKDYEYKTLLHNLELFFNMILSLMKLEKEGYSFAPNAAIRTFNGEFYVLPISLENVRFTPLSHIYKELVSRTEIVFCKKNDSFKIREKAFLKLIDEKKYIAAVAIFVKNIQSFYHTEISKNHYNICLVFGNMYQYIIRFGMNKDHTVMYGLKIDNYNGYDTDNDTDNDDDDEDVKLDKFINKHINYFNIGQMNTLGDDNENYDINNLIENQNNNSDDKIGKINDRDENIDYYSILNKINELYDSLEVKEVDASISDLKEQTFENKIEPLDIENDDYKTDSNEISSSFPIDKESVLEITEPMDDTFVYSVGCMLESDTSNNDKLKSSIELSYDLNLILDEALLKEEMEIININEFDRLGEIDRLQTEIDYDDYISYIEPQVGNALELSTDKHNSDKLSVNTKQQLANTLSTYEEKQDDSLLNYLHKDIDDISNSAFEHFDNDDNISPFPIDEHTEEIINAFLNNEIEDIYKPSIGVQLTENTLDNDNKNSDKSELDLDLDLDLESFIKDFIKDDDQYGTKKRKLENENNDKKEEQRYKKCKLQ